MSLPQLNFVVPGDQDILCGRSHSFFNHPGNVRFREIIARHMSEYLLAETKSAKTSVVREVVRKIWSKGGKFLKLDKASNRWFESDALCATSKVGHAFRDAIAEHQVHSARKSDERDQHPRVDSGSDTDSSNKLASSLLLLGRAASEIVSVRSDPMEQRRSKNPPKDKPGATCSTYKLKKSHWVSVLQEPKRSSEHEGLQETAYQEEPKKCALSQEAGSQSKRVRPSICGSSTAFQRGRSSSVGFNDVPLSKNSPKSSMRSIEAQVELNQSSVSLRHWPAVAAPTLPFPAPQLGPSNQKSLLSRHALQSSAQLSLRDPKSNPLSSHHQSVMAMPSALTAQDQEPRPFMVPGFHQRLPGMMYTRELKKVMYQTLALRQKALEQSTANHGCNNNANEHTNVDELIEKAKANVRSPSEILKQALAAQTTSLILNSGNNALEMKDNDIICNGNSGVISTEPHKSGKLPRNDNNRAAVGASALPHSTGRCKDRNEASNDSNMNSTAERALYAIEHQQMPTEKISIDSHMNEIVASASPSETAVVSPDSLKKPYVPQTMLLDLQGTKRRRSPDMNTTEPPKKRVPLAQVAADYTMQSQNCLGSFCTFSREVDESTKSMYFL